MKMSEVRTAVVRYFSDKATYRERLAEEHPHSADKNSSYAKSLRLVSRYVEKLPDDDPTLQHLLEHCYVPGIDTFELPPMSRYDRESAQNGWQHEADIQAIHCGPRGRVIEEGELPDWFGTWARLIDERLTDIVRRDKVGNEGQR